MFGKAPRPGFSVHGWIVIPDINRFANAQISLMFFSGQNFNLVIFVDFSVAHVGMPIKSVVPEPGLRFPKPGVAQVLIETSPNRTSRLPNIGGRGTLSLTRQACEFVDGHACCMYSDLPDRCCTCGTVYVPMSKAGEWALKWLSAFLEYCFSSNWL